MAGLVAAKCNNHIGICGVAPGAKLIQNELLSSNQNYQGNFLNLIATIENDTKNNDISINSWGGEDSTGQYQSLSNYQYETWRRAMENSLQKGRNGKGTVFVWAAGNGTNKYLEIDNSNYDSIANFYGNITVCSVDKYGNRSVYSEKGTNLWVCAPSSANLMSNPGEVITTANDSGYTNHFGGTSASAAIVGGVVALMLEVNPALTWRDVKIILAQGASKNGIKIDDWQINGGQFQVSDDFGFGVVDAEKAVALSKTWKNLPEIKTYKSDISSSGGIQIKKSGINFIEFIEINIDFNKSTSDNVNASNLKITLESPSGTKSILQEPHVCRNNLKKVKCKLPSSWVYGSAMYLGENPEGKWELIAEVAGKQINLPERWSLRIFGN
jgi:kexin